MHLHWSYHLSHQNTGLFQAFIAVYHLQHCSTHHLIQLFIIAFLIGPFLFGFVYAKTKKQPDTQP